MKKKQIEKIPWIRPVKDKSRKTIFVLVSGKEMIGGEECLIMDVYRKKDLTKPEIRLAYTKKDWAVYWPEENLWNGCGIHGEYGQLQWESSETKRGEQTYVSKETREEIVKFCNPRIWNRYSRWDDAIRELQDDIRWKRKKRTRENKCAALEERKRNTTKLSKRFFVWVSKILLGEENYLFYKRKDRYTTITCSHCGKTYTRAIKRTESYEGQFERVIQTTKAGQKALCELCGTEGVYKTAGNAKDTYEINKKCYVGQSYKEKGAVIRYIHAKKRICQGKPEEIEIIEIARVYFGEKKIQKDYHLYNPWENRNEWCYHNVGGMGSVQMQPATMWPGSYELLKGSILQYSAAMEYAEHFEKVKWVDYMERYWKTPCLERIVKAGLYKLAEQMVRFGVGVKEPYAQKLPDALGVYRQRLRFLAEKQGEVKLYEILQIEREKKYSWTEEQIQSLVELGMNGRQIQLVLQYMGIQRFLNKVEKYAGVTFEEGKRCGTAIARLGQMAVLYEDYIRMREQVGDDLTNTVYLFPRDLNEAHEKMVMQINKDKIEKREREAEEKFPEIKKMYRTQRKRYFYEDENFLIRPARSAKEIVKEGRELHHCVGGDGYLDKNNRKETVILFLRLRKTPDIPYITVEIKDNEITQWYGMKNTQPDKEIVKPWLNRYVAMLATGLDTKQLLYDA